MIRVFGLKRFGVEMIPIIEYLGEVNNDESHENLVEIARRFAYCSRYCAIILTLTDQETYCFTHI